MIISFKPSGYSREEMVSAVEAMGHPYAFSGLKRREIEDFFCQHTGRGYALAVRDLITPILVLLKYLGMGHKTRALLSPLSYFKHFSPYLRLLGIEPLYTDVERWSLNMDVKRLSNVLSDDIRLLMVNNSLGIPSDWDSIKNIPVSKETFLIEDSRETIFTEYKGERAGSFGYVSLFSFSESSIVRGYGGIVLTDDLSIHKELEEKVEPMDDTMSAIILSQLNNLEENLKRRYALADLYSRLLLGIEGIKPIFIPNYVTKMYWSYFCVHLGKRYSEDARALVTSLMADDGIEVIEYPVPQDIKEGTPLNHLHIAHEVGTRALLLPFHEDLEEEDVYFICERLKEHTVQVGAGSRDH
ncbi:MAG: DegT/DnrJ/EryC1/StrS family aminotransferase [Aquificaceae bacterium]